MKSIRSRSRLLLALLIIGTAIVGLCFLFLSATTEPPSAPAPYGAATESVPTALQPFHREDDEFLDSLLSDIESVSEATRSRGRSFSATFEPGQSILADITYPESGGVILSFLTVDSHPNPAGTL